MVVLFSVVLWLFQLGEREAIATSECSLIELLAQVFLLSTELHGNFFFFFFFLNRWVGGTEGINCFSPLSLQKRRMQKQQKQGLPFQELQRRK